MKTLIVVASHNHPERLHYLFDDGSPFWKMGVEGVQVCVVDNGSNHTGTKAMYDHLEHQCGRLVIHRANVGYETGAFQAAQVAYPDFDRYMFLQDDTGIQVSNWLQRFEAAFNATPYCGAVGHIIYREGRHLTCEGSVMPVLDELRLRMGRPNVFYNQFIGGAMLYTSRVVLDELNKFGGIAHPQEQTAAGRMFGFICERLFSTMIENLGHPITAVPGTIVNGWSDGGGTR